MFSIARTGVGGRKVIARLMKLLTRRSVLVAGDEGSGYLADGDADSEDARTHARTHTHTHTRTLRPLQAAACSYRIAFGPRAGQKVFTVQGAMP